jgi:hypothetical protein
MAGFCLFPHNSAASIGYYLAYRNIDAELKEIRWYAEFVRLPQNSGVSAKTAGITVRQWSRRRSKRSMIVAGRTAIAKPDQGTRLAMKGKLGASTDGRPFAGHWSLCFQPVTGFY